MGREVLVIEGVKTLQVNSSVCTKAKCNHWRVLSRELTDEVYHSGECIEEQIYSKKCEVLFKIYFSIPISPNYTGVLLFSKL